MDSNPNYDNNNGNGKAIEKAMSLTRIMLDGTLNSITIYTRTNPLLNFWFNTCYLFKPCLNLKLSFKSCLNLKISFKSSLNLKLSF